MLPTLNVTKPFQFGLQLDLTFNSLPHCRSLTSVCMLFQVRSLYRRRKLVSCVSIPTVPNSSLLPRWAIRICHREALLGRRGTNVHLLVFLWTLMDKNPNHANCIYCMEYSSTIIIVCAKGTDRKNKSFVCLCAVESSVERERIWCYRQHFTSLLLGVWDAGMEKRDYCRVYKAVRIKTRLHKTQYVSPFLLFSLSLSLYAHCLSSYVSVCLFLIALYCLGTIAKLVWLKRQCIPSCTPLSFKNQSLPLFCHWWTWCLFITNTFHFCILTGAPLPLKPLITMQPQYEYWCIDLLYTVTLNWAKTCASIPLVCIYISVCI